MHLSLNVPIIDAFHPFAFNSDNNYDKKIILCLFKRKHEWCALNSARPRFVKHQNQFVLTKRNRHNENDHTLSGDFHRQDQRRSHN